MNAWMNRLGRRWIAGLLAIAMLSGTIPAALAAEEDPKHTAESTSQEELLLLEETRTVQATDPSVPETEQTVAETETTAVEETTQEELLLGEEEEEENLLLDMAMMPMLLMEEGDPVALSDDEGLTLDDVNRLAKICQTFLNLTNLPFFATTDVNGQVTKAEVQGTAGLILLSNLNPSLYSNAAISLTLNNNDKYDLVTPLTFQETAADETIIKHEYEFKGLGGTNAAFAGSIRVTNDSVRVFYTSRSLFNNLDTRAQLLDKNSDSLELSLGFKLNDNQIDLSTPVLAEKVQGTETANWSLKLLESAAIGGIIGTMDSGTVNLSVQVADGANMTVRSDYHAGFFCNQMNGGTLTATLDGSGAVSVTAESGSAGGYVGYMAKGVSLTANSKEGASVSVTSVTAQTGSAGGIVGSVGESDAGSQAEINVNAVPTTSVIAQNGSAGGYVGEILAGTAISAAAGLAELTTISATANVGGLVGKAVETMITPSNTIAVSKVTLSRYSAGESDILASAGGLIGDYSVTQDGSVDLSQFTIDVTLPSGSCTNAGGVFGALSNGASYTISGGVDENNQPKTAALSSTGGADNYGGVLGTYTADALSDTLKISGLHVTLLTQNSTNYGGIIASLPSASYVEMSGLAAATSGSSSTFGGLVASMGDSADKAAFLNVAGNVTVSGDSGSTSGGLVGSLGYGVLRLNGTTDLYDFSIVPGETKGWILGSNDNGLVYGTSAWLPLRKEGCYASNIGNWGEVVRLDGTKLIENELLEIDTAHTVKVLNGDVTSIATVRDFAAYALAFDLSQVYANSPNAALQFTQTVNPYEQQTVSLGENDIDLTGTGILGIGKDNNAAGFFGTFDGNNKTVTLDIGKKIDTLWANEWSAHCRLALFPAVNGATEIRKVIVAGCVNASVIQYGGSPNIAGVVAYQNGDLTCTNVTVTSAMNAAGAAKMAGVSAYQNGDLTCTNVTVTSAMNAAGTGAMAGMVAQCAGGKTSTYTECKVSGSITATTTDNAVMGGLVAQVDWSDTTGSICLSNVTVSETMTAAEATGTSGGLLGYQWLNTNVSFSNPGVTISGATLNAGSAKFGGLVYQATGYWNATAANSIKFTGVKAEDGTVTKATQISGGTETTDPSGLLVGTGIYSYNTTHYNNLYLEVGTFGEVGAAYYYEKDAVTLILPDDTTSFDELVGETIVSNFGHDNAVVSLATANDEIDNGGACTTYISQTGTNYQNPKTRYYYNLNSYRENVDAGNLTSPGDVLCWSVSQYAAENIRGYFCANYGGEAKISGGDIDLTHYSYYPITAYNSVTVNCTGLTFGYETIQSVEDTHDNKRPSKQNQHYLMHYGLLYGLGGNLSVSGTPLSGTVGKLSDKSGALILNTISGDAANKVFRTIELRGVTLAGLRVSGVTGDSGVYPLLINNVGEAVTLTVDGLWTGEGYVEDGATLTAATSLIGAVGSNTASNLTLSFRNMALDGRKPAAAGETSVYNDGRAEVKYGTKQSIFTRAILLESLQYAKDSSGVYNFNKGDTLVTYGVEISNTETGRNPKKQYQYYDDGFVSDVQNVSGTEDTVKSRFTGNNFLRYVNCVEGADGNCHELDINQKAIGLTNGCGTYGDPYIITDGQQLMDLAKYLGGTTVSGFSVTFNKDVMEAQNGKDYTYHLNGEGGDKDAIYTWNGSAWTDADDKDQEAVFTTNASNYLRNAYYKITTPVTIPLKEGNYQGLGTYDQPFSGVITGGTVELTGTLNNQTDFGGLIRYSRGSVVKDVTVKYSATITMSNAEVPSSANNPFFGGVVGYCMGGDTIIDNVTVSYDNGTITLFGNNGYDRLIAAGGYVGLVGGGKDGSNYEKTGGGVVFRNMGSHSNDFASCQSNAVAESRYFYCNPYVGRVLDGYACYEGGNPGSFTLDNTDKNYTIPDVNATGDSGLSVDYANKTVTVSSAQGLWLLSAIVNSGAGAMNSEGKYLDYEDRNYVEAYQYGKPRTCNYNLIGKSEGSSDIADEAYWGITNNNPTGAVGRVSYLVNKYAPGAQYLTGRDGATTKNHNSSYTLTFTAPKIDMSGYKNGFRGIGGSFGQKAKDQNSMVYVYRRSLRVNQVSGASAGASGGTTITLEMEQHDYQAEYDAKCWSNQGAGLFTVLYFENISNTDPALVENLTISGKVSALTYNASSGKKQGSKKVDYDSGLGGFASRTGNSSSHKLKFNNFHLHELIVIGGTATGGVIGLNACAGDIEFTNWTISDVQVNKWVTNDGSTGGFVGWHNSGKQIKIVGYGSPEGESDRTYNVQGLTVSITADEMKHGNIGGFSGANDNNSTLFITDVNVQDMKVTGKAARNVGGLADGGKHGITIDNCWLEGISVTAQKNEEGVASGQVGGLIGFSDGGTKSITNVTITGTSTITSNASGAVGGIVGSVSGGTTTIRNASIDGKTIVESMAGSGAVGGIVGSAGGGTTNIQNSTVQGNTTVTSQAGSGAVGGIVGSAGGGTTNIQNSTVQGNTTVKMVSGSNGYTGGAVGSASSTLNITGLSIIGNTQIYSECDTTISCNDNKLARVGGFVGYGSNKITIEESDITGSVNMPIRILNSTPKDNENNVAGGLIGCLDRWNNTVSVKNSSLEYVFVLSGDTAGGLVGVHDQNLFSISNVTIDHCVVAVPKQINGNLRANDRAGLLVGYSKNYIVGYNILANQSTVGYYSDWQAVDTKANPPKKADILLGEMCADSINTSTLGLHDNDNSNKEGNDYYLYTNITKEDFVSKRLGRWVGEFRSWDASESPTGKRTCTLVAVAVNGGNLPNTDVGRATDIDKIMQVTYADYPADRKNENGSRPWLDVNPKVTIGNLSLTGNGVGSVTSEENGLTGYGEIILNAAKNANANRKYRNVPTGSDTYFAKLLDNKQDAYVSTYRTEESASTTVDKNVDFPILVLSASDPDTWLWYYIAALTNVASGDIAKKQATNVEVKSYQWKDSQFQEASSSLKVENDKTIKVVTGAYDNEASRFTLLDVQYADPTRSGNVFHLYVPVLVKKVLEVHASVNIKAGTNYLPTAYTDTGDYEAAGIHEPITAYISYKYARGVDEWNVMLNDGASLLWSYNKTLDLHGKSTSLPVGTRLTVVNTLNDQMATYTLTEDDVTTADSPARKFDLSAKMGLAAPMMSELLNINVAEWNNGDQNRYVKLNNEDGATVKVGNDYYRPATDDDTTGSFYCLTAGKEAEEAYFLTIQIPESVQQLEEKMYVNVLRINKTLTREGSGPPARILEKDPYYSYLLYDCMKQTSFSIKTTHLRGNGEVSDTEMINDDKILVALSTTLDLTDKGKEKFDGNGPKEVHHRFLLELKEHKNGQVPGIPIGATHIEWTYTLTLVNDMGVERQIDSFTGEDSPGVMETFPINAADYMDGGLPKEIKDQWVNVRKEGDTYNRLKIEAQLLLSYGDNVGSVFPSRTLSNDKDGANYCAESRMAYVGSQLPIAAVQRAYDGKAADSESYTLYYCAQPTSTTLTFEALDFYGDGGKTLQLGINPDDPTDDRRIQTEAIYEYGGVSESDLAEAKYIRYKLELFRKPNSGSYTDGPALSNMREYLTELRTSEDVQFAYEKVEDSNEIKDTRYMIVDKELPSNFAAIEPKSQRICIDFSPCTGLEFEQKTAIDPVYSNYMLRLTVSLLKANREDVQGTAVSDWIIYTNARVKRELVDFLPSAG